MLGFDPKQQPTLNQALTMMQFGHTFEIKDPQYWRTARRLTETALITHKALSTVSLFEVATYMKQFDLLSNAVLRLVAQ
jgi:hypothetical protein